jgi:hypothetical protein
MPAITTDQPLEVLAVQLGDRSGYVTHELDDAVTATYFAPTSEVVLTLTRTPRRLWRYAGSDFCTWTSTLDRKRWDSPAAALHGVARRMGHATIAQVEL